MRVEHRRLGGNPDVLGERGDDALVPDTLYVLSGGGLVDRHVAEW